MSQLYTYVTTWKKFLPSETVSTDIASTPLEMSSLTV